MYAYSFNIIFFSVKGPEQAHQSVCKIFNYKGTANIKTEISAFDYFHQLIFLWKYKNRMHTGSKWMIKYHLHQKYLQRFT